MKWGCSMAYLHENRKLFQQVVDQAQRLTGWTPEIVEKDYYVTVILRELSARLPFVVFKGGTSLSKCYQVIARYSEDIDITIDTKLSQGQKRSVKGALKDLTQTMGLSIPNLEETHSRRSYNKYDIRYEPLHLPMGATIQSGILLETSFAEISFPVVTMDVHSIVGDMLETEAPEIRSEYGLQPFPMKVQSLERTLADKLFAIGDYYLAGREINKHSRHLYDIYKLFPLVKMDETFHQLVLDARKEREKNDICLSAQEGVSLPALLQKIITEGAYRYGYNHLTVRLLDEDVSYEEAVAALTKIIESNVL